MSKLALIRSSGPLSEDAIGRLANFYLDKIRKHITLPPNTELVPQPYVASSTGGTMIAKYQRRDNLYLHVLMGVDQNGIHINQHGVSASWAILQNKLDAIAARWEERMQKAARKSAKVAGG